MKRRRRSVCPVSYSLDIFGDKWTMLILRDLLLLRGKYYGDFLNSPEKIATNILADRLQNLVDCGLVTKKEDPKNKRQTIYSPTKKASALLPVLRAMIDWGLKFGKGTKLPVSKMTR